MLEGEVSIRRSPKNEHGTHDKKLGLYRNQAETSLIFRANEDVILHPRSAWILQAAPYESMNLSIHPHAWHLVCLLVWQSFPTVVTTTLNLTKLSRRWTCITYRRACTLSYWHTTKFACRLHGQKNRHYLPAPSCYTPMKPTYLSYASVGWFTKSSFFMCKVILPGCKLFVRTNWRCS